MRKWLDKWEILSKFVMHHMTLKSCTMKINYLYILGIPLFILVLFSCKKKEEQTESSVSTTTLNAAATGGTVVSTQMQKFMMTCVGVAADSGHVFFIPTNDTSHLKSVSATEDYPWIGPDANGWYTRFITGGVYNYSEKLRMGDTIDYIMEVSYHGAEGSYDSKTTTKYIKEIKNGKTLYNGSSIWDVQNSGYNEISHWEWRIYFNDWNPSTSAGTYDWFWGLYENSGGNTVPYHCFQHLAATETNPSGWLHCLVIFYDDGGTETWRFEYNTLWVPVEMPKIPGWN